MKLQQFLIILLLSMGVIACDPSSEPESDKKEDRNMFGFYIPRGLTKTSENLTPGYLMYAVPNSALVYLIDREGQVVYQWKGNHEILSTYLQEDGTLFQNAVDPDFPVFTAGGQTGRLQHLSADSLLLWDFEYGDEEQLAHHDIAVLPNGNILTVAYEEKTFEESLQAGRNPVFIQKDGIWPEKIVEVKPQGKRGGEIVWEWHIWDHMIQDFDPQKDNYGDPSQHPELLDINVSDSIPDPISQDSLNVLYKLHEVHRNRTPYNRGSDIYHFNAINYNPELDQIAFSSPDLSEIFIIDHSTTTEEAAGHTGGAYGKGGDFLYRWGNPENYRRGDSTHRSLYFQHDIKWIEKGLPGAGNLMVFNNAVPMGPDSLSYSVVMEFSAPMDDAGNYLLNEEGRYSNEPVWQYIAPDTISFFSSFISGAHRMKNGNTFITEGAKARLFEVTPEGEILWEYLNQFRGEIRYPNGDPKDPMPYAYMLFRSTFIPADHPGLQNLELKPMDPQPVPFKLPPKKS